MNTICGGREIATAEMRSARAHWQGFAVRIADMAVSKSSAIQFAANGALYAPLAALVATALIGKAEDAPSLQLALRALSLVLALAGIVMGLAAILMARPFRINNSGIGGVGLSVVVTGVLLYYFLFVPHLALVRMVGHYRTAAAASGISQAELTLNQDGTFKLGPFPANATAPGLTGRWAADAKGDIQMAFDPPPGDSQAPKRVVQAKQVDERTIALPTKNGEPQTYKKSD